MKSDQRTAHRTGWSFAWGICIAIIAFGTQSARADKVTAKISKPAPAYQVISNGSSYHQVQGALGSVQFSVTADAEIAGRVKSVSYEVGAAVTGSPDIHHGLPPHSDSETYPGDLVDQRTLYGSYAPDASQLVAACNSVADALRAQGKGDTEIFGADRPLTMTVNVSPDATFSVATAFTDLVADSVSSQVLCRKWSGAVGFTPPAAVKAADGVSDSNLTLIEQYGQSGLCKVVLSGVITTTAANMEVKFRYEHFDGKKSDVKTVTTDHSKTAFFSHDYEIPDEDGPEGGSIRMIGVSPSFTSAAAAYSMDCSEGGPAGIQASLLPAVSLQAIPAGQTEVGGQICPTELRLQGKIQGKGGGKTSGQAFFVGPGYASPHQPYQVSGNETVLIEAVRELEWTAQPAQGFTTGQAPAPAPAPARSQTMVAGFNIMGANNTEIAHVPQKPFTITCVKPATLDRPVVIGTLPNPATPRDGAQRPTTGNQAPAQPRQTDTEFLRAPATRAPAKQTDKVTVRGWDSRSKEADTADGAQREEH